MALTNAGRDLIAADVIGESVTELTEREQVVWAAGLFEGEGSVFWANSSRRAEMRLASTDEDVVRRFHEVVGVGSVGGPYMAAKSTKPFWNWVCAGYHHVQAVGAAFWPFLGERRQAKVREVLTLGRHRVGGRRRGAH